MLDLFAVRYRYRYRLARGTASLTTEYARLVIYITELGALSCAIISIMEWNPIDTAPFDRDLELAVIDDAATQVVAFPCRRLAGNGWIDAETNKQIHYIRPTHWRDWPLG